MRLYFADVDTEAGPFRVGVDDAGRLRRTSFLAGEYRRDTSGDWIGAVPGGAALPAAAQFRQYLTGQRREFDLVLSLDGSEFERTVWQALLAVRYGQTASYGEIARRIGAAGKARAVGRANGANRLPVVVPCHRIVGSDGDLTGYGGGLHIKRYLLELEGAITERLF